MEDKEPKDTKVKRFLQFIALTPPNEAPFFDNNTFEPLPDNNAQIETLEYLACELSKSGHDVSEASRMLDDLRMKIQSTQVTPSQFYHEKLNQVRGLLYGAPKRRWFSNTIWPYLLMFFEFFVIGLWAWLIISHRSTYNQLLLGVHWSLLYSVFVAAVTGSIGATSFAIYGLYTHMSHHNMEPSFISWYISRPVVGGVMGAFVGVVGSVLLSGVGATGDGANAFTLGISFLAGSNERFSAQMIERFMSKVLGVNETNKLNGKKQSDKQ